MTIQSIESYYLLHCPQATQIAEEPHTQAEQTLGRLRVYSKFRYHSSLPVESPILLTFYLHIIFRITYHIYMQLEGDLMQLIYCTTSKVCYKIFEEATLSGHGVSTVSKLSGRTQQRRRRS